MSGLLRRLTVGAAALLLAAGLVTAAPSDAATYGSRTSPKHSGPTSWAALNDAIWRIPNYDPSIAHWHVADKGSWGATQLDTGDIYIAPRAPSDLLYSIAAHEYGHALAGHLYGGFYPAEAAADSYFGQRGEYGLEIEADCMARVEGASWTYYTSCTSQRWRAGARTLLAWKLLPGTRAR